MGNPGPTPTSAGSPEGLEGRIQGDMSTCGAVWSGLPQAGSADVGNLSRTLASRDSKSTGVYDTRKYRKLQFETVGVGEPCLLLELLVVWLC